ncbi:alpha/beta hydrolase [Rhodococcus rhodnii]|uniref:Alpha/beta hydrolase n=2 Tax=Rhodococcus rhodnii TaxID=38312 RepID=R7WH50_9NOCA|nr:hypothetical protein [Rhodococcus rhodnii]EOM74480.1 hypothetical protein Rrhod_4283 [Rhodococcus rhodnii LMG 5362]TXG89171.1 alpha/beta hydrolase [Rhodococcus rhodnii]
MMREIPDRGSEPIVCVHDRPGGAHWFAEQIDTLGARPVEVEDVLDIDDDASLARWLRHVVGEIGSDAPVHVLATGPAAYAAVVLAARYPDLVRSLLLGDPRIPGDTEEYRDLLASVRTPTLVIASAIEGASDRELAVPQSIAGGIDNGVFVVIDGVAVPAHRERGSSFDEWATSFTVIAEGLGALEPRRQEKADA